jgi:hypothetical protein
MKIYSETSLSSFEFWSGAKHFASKLTDEEFEQIESILELENPNGMNETEINDMFWFEDEIICEWLGLSVNEVLSRN